jgi:parallel beta-helix repeat protein
MKRTISWIILTCLLASAFFLAFAVKPAQATPVTIIINSDGSVSPSYAPISSFDNITYTLTNNVSYPTYDGISVGRNDIVINGNGYTVLGNGSGNGLDLTDIHDITIKNLNIQHFQYGIYLSNSNNNKISGNNITSNSYVGIYLDSSPNNVISDNIATGNVADGIYFSSSSSNNTVSRNTVTANNVGVLIIFSSSNMVYHNNLVNNTYGALFNGTGSNSWDNGYPSGGNYWRDYNGTDTHTGPYQNQTGIDGIGDTAYSIATNNTDRYPLMGWFGSSTSTGLNVTIFPSDDICLVFHNVTVGGSTTVNEMQTYAPALSNLTGEYYDILVAANYSGNITVRLIFDGSNMTLDQKSKLQLMQYTPLAGDITGSGGVPDGKVDIRDIALIARAFGSVLGQPNWNPICDLNGDNRINILDIAIAAKNFGRSGWVNITASIDTADNVIYGITTHFSVIGIHQE